MSMASSSHALTSDSPLLCMSVTVYQHRPLSMSVSPSTSLGFTVDIIICFLYSVFIFLHILWAAYICIGSLIISNMFILFILFSQTPPRSTPALLPIQLSLCPLLTLFILLFYMMSILPVSMNTHHAHSWCPLRSQEGVGSPGRGLQTVVRHHVDAESGTQVLS